MKQTYHHKNLKKTIKERLLKEIRESCDIKISFRQISRDLNISHNAIYHHFKNKDEVLKYTIELCFEIFEKELLKGLSNLSSNAEDPIKLAGFRYYKFCKAEPNLYLFMFNNIKILSGQESEGYSKRAFSILLNVAGDDKEKAYFLWAYIHGLCTLLLTDSFESMKMCDNDIDQKVLNQLSLINF